MRSVLPLFLALLLAAPTQSLAQPGDTIYQSVFLSNWPPELQDAVPPDPDDDTLYPYDLLPFVDTLALGYAMDVVDAQPVLDFRLDWQPGAYGVYDDVLMPYDDLPPDLRIVAVDLRAGVWMDDRLVAELHVALDSLALPSWPEAYVWTETRAWNAVFTDLSADSARALLAAGFALHDLQIERIAFASYGEEEADEPGYIDPRYPTDVGFYPPRVGIWVDWIIWPRSTGKRGVTGTRREPREGIGRDVPSDERRPRTRTGRGEGETDDQARPDRSTGDREDATADRERTRRTPRSGKTDKKGDDEDDDEELLPAVLAGAAAVGALAVLGGTVGYYGNTEAPIGLSAGVVRPQGGALLQVAVNDGVLGSGKPEKLLGKVTAFYDFFRAPVQPAAGVGVFAEEKGGDVELTPTLSLGAVGNFGLVVLYGGYDVTAAGVDFGLLLNFRRRR